ncbi:hypothetical protein [Vibrio sp. YIC-376]|uniref:hypothetical protein n=1 Tax=Vibrio sp. YIC-376 TaxID=3136162 RepID=UPI00402AA21B
MKHQNKVLLISILVVGCSSSSDSVTALKNWDNKYEMCFMSQSDNPKFPDNVWFKSLSIEDQKAVIGYLYNYNSRNCIKDEAEALKLALIRDGNEALLHLFQEDLSPLEEAVLEAVNHLDQAELMKLQKDFSRPFNLSKLVDDLNLYN